MRIGFGYDVHRLESNRKLILGGVDIPSEKGLSGHSDADVLIHSIIDALLGALALGDIGTHFPDDSDEYSRIDSRILLRQVGKLISNEGYKAGNIDTTICLQRPKLRDHIEKMRENIASDLAICKSAVSVKATTEEKLGISGSEQGAVCYAVVLLVKT